MPRRRITFHQLDIFAAVARHRSFSKAADSLHLTQPAVSLQIKHIADILGLPLFEQEGRAVVLTAAGEEVLKTVRELDDVWARLESAIDELKGLKRGRLRVALVPTAKYFLPRMLGDFSRRYPEVSIELEIADRERIVSRMRGNQDDLYIMVYPPEDLEVVSYPFLDNELVVIAPVDHWAAAQQIEFGALLGERFILREVGSGSRRTIDAHLLLIGEKLDVKLAVSSNEAIRELVASGMGLAVLSRHALPANPASDGLCILDVQGFPLRKPWRAVHLKSKLLSLPARAFLDELLASRSSPTAVA
ncbi:MAG: LysR substrate-binding domain-containing protein [Candidatus Accumulibacter phosphatis]|jgi:DNA-binding transcriptional LysR family regulator|uniref:LysR family transcriptional regulator n=1 Tax=Candidatus Accumulibacter contiguus TaxID=2954381 RepID=A0ABX1TC35_9PROT|nr:LysR substrate-binding domain-containing protein [Candidatus Accumulibacter contiguus]MBL8408473.1 LysR family transcriptional regulator [Accumulibacter sp.]NMQ05802.1 LysR family transcriptional regulator [Candidatus Accumulibacter contiguus]